MNARKHLIFGLGLALLLACWLAPVARAEFGIAELTTTALGSDGSVVSQAGAHPYEYTVHIGMNLNANRESEGELRNLIVNLPPGLVGDPQAVPRCSRAEFEGFVPYCPPTTQVGVVVANSATGISVSPVYNLVPPQGVAASFGLSIFEVNGFEDPGLRTGGDYGVTVGDNTVPTGLGLKGIDETIWGVPADPAHDSQRYCRLENGKQKTGCKSELKPLPFLTLPTSCTGPLVATAQVESLEAPGVLTAPVTALSRDAGGNPVGLSGCEKPPFDPTLVVAPETSVGDSPTGLHVGLHVPQNEDPEGLATAHLKDAVVALPRGMVVDPSSADGLGSCSPAQIDLAGPEPAGCPADSKIGTVLVQTPLLDHPVPGAVYLASQGDNPFHSLIALYIAVYDPISGVVVKLPGRVETDPVTGQVTARFEENPQLPFEDLSVDLYGGPRAPLTTPLVCGVYATMSDLTPWSSPAGADAFPSSAFSIGSGCVSNEAQAPNAPSFEAGTVTPLSGVFSPFVFKVSREDGSQRFKSINVTLPLGLVGRLAGVEECSQAQIEAAEHRSHEGDGRLEQQNPSCPAGSELGTVTVGAGSGSPLYVTGHAYLAGPYEGAPFSAVVVTPAVAGPFDLGTVVVRAALYINPETAQVTIKSDPFPSILDGIPLDIRSVAVDVSRGQFMFNPTSCEASGVTGELVSTTGQVAHLANHFQVGGCAGLAFKPTFTVSTSAKASKANGASFDVKLTPPAQGPQNGNGEEANIRYVKVELPKALPSRLTTLQKACTVTQFNANPAGCPAASSVGVATVHTPVLANPLTGPAYFVSHGSEAFPQLDIVLQGEGVTVELAGNTFISKAGVTSSTFKTVPDVPVSSFELDLPQGPYSALTANTNLCAQPLLMPTEFVAQNGARYNQQTRIEVEGCPNALAITGHTIKRQTLTVKVYVPAAGKIIASGKGLTTKTKTAKGRETVTLTLKQKQAGKLKTTVKVLFTPSAGKDRKRQVKTLRVAFKK